MRQVSLHSSKYKFDTTEKKLDVSKFVVVEPSSPVKNNFMSKVTKQFNKLIQIKEQKKSFKNQQIIDE